MAGFRWTENAGLPGFGMDDLSNYSSKGYSDSDIKSFLEGNRQYFGYGKMGVGDDVRQRLGLDDGFINYHTTDTPDQRYAKAWSSYRDYVAASTPAASPIVLPTSTPEQVTSTSASNVAPVTPPVQDFKLDDQAKAQREFLDRTLNARLEKFQTLLDRMSTV